MKSPENDVNTRPSGAQETGDDLAALRAEYSDDPVARAAYDRQAADLDTQLYKMVNAISKEVQIQRIRLAEIRREDTVLPLLHDAFEHGEAFAGALLIALNGSDVNGQKHALLIAALAESGMPDVTNAEAELAIKHLLRTSGDFQEAGIEQDNVTVVRMVMDCIKNEVRK